MIFRHWLRRRSTRRLLRLARAGRSLRRSDKPFANLELCSLLESTNAGLPSNAFRRYGGLAPAARACLRQRLVESAGYQHLLRDLMVAAADPHKPVAITAPASWREALRAGGVLIAGSTWRWWKLVGVLYASGVRAAVSRVADILAGRMPQAPREEYAVLLHLSPNMIPRGEAPGFDFLSWYLQSNARDSRIREIWAHVPREQAIRTIARVTVTSRYLPGLEGWRANLRFLLSLIWVTASVTARGLVGQWWEMAMLSEFVDVAYARNIHQRNFARAYVFHNARFIVRPLWTYVAEEAGATIDLAFYGSNIETFGVRRDQLRSVWPGYRGMTWQRYAVWDEFQASFLRGLGLSAPIIIDGPIGLTDSDTTSAGWSKPYVAVFDVTPHRPASLAARGIPQPYYAPEVWKRFMADIQAALQVAGYGMVYKKKREIGRVAAAASRSPQERVAAADPDVAPQRLISEAAGVISMPFTSTALIAQGMGKPVVFYDPLGVLVEEHQLSHGIHVIGTRTELERWLAALREPQLLQQPVS